MEAKPPPAGALKQDASKINLHWMFFRSMLASGYVKPLDLIMLLFLHISAILNFKKWGTV